MVVRSLSDTSSAELYRLQTGLGSFFLKMERTKSVNPPVDMPQRSMLS